MAITPINIPALEADDWTDFITLMTSQMKGLIKLTLTNYSNTSAPSIAAGSIVEIDGTFYQFTTDEAVTGSPTDAQLNYIKLSNSGGTITVAWASANGTWSDSKQGYYDGTSRFVGQCWYTTSGTAYTRKIVFDQYYYNIVNKFDLDTINKTSTEQVFNENGADIDFRIESDSDTDAFVLDAGGDLLKTGTNIKIATGGETTPDVDAGGVCTYLGSGTNAYTAKLNGFAHGITSIAETDTWYRVIKDGTGGANIQGYASGVQNGLLLRGWTNGANTGHLTDATVSIFAAKKDTGTSESALADDETAFGVLNAGTGAKWLMTVLGSGSLKTAAGRWPTNTVHGTSITRGTVYTSLNDSLPNVGDKIIITGGINSNKVVSYAERTSTGNIRIYYHDGAAASFNDFTPGSTITNNFSLAW